MQQAATYQERSREFLARASEELDADLAQASEKGWGAAAAMVKAVAAERGWQHQSHHAIHVAITDLAREIDDPDLLTLFLVANSLHTNFYENWYTKELVASGIRQVERFVTKVEALLSSPPQD